MSKPLNEEHYSEGYRLLRQIVKKHSEIWMDDNANKTFAELRREIADLIIEGHYMFLRHEVDIREDDKKSPQ